MSQITLAPDNSLIELGSPFTALAETPSAASRPADRAVAPRKVPAAPDWPPVISVHEDLAAVEALWRALQAESDCTAFQTFDWIATWQNHVGTLSGTKPAIIAGQAADGRPLFLFALAIERQHGLKCLTWLASDVCDYNAPLLARDFAAALDADRFRHLWRDIRRLIAGNPHLRFDYVDLERMPETIGALRNPFMALKPDEHPSSAHACALFGDWETFYAAKRSASTRKTARKQFKQIQKHGPVAFEDITDMAERARTFDVLMEQKAQSLARMGVDNFFERPGHRDFYRALVTNPAMCEFVHITRLTAGDTIAATSVGLSLGGCFYLVLASYDAGPISAHGPGRAHLHELLRHAIEQGYQLFDFTVGDEGYKFDWSDRVIRLYDYLSGRTLPGWAPVLATRAFRRSKRLIKQTPVLWRLYQGLRARFGGGKTGSGHRDDC